MAQQAWIALSRAHSDAYARGQEFVRRAEDIERRHWQSSLRGHIGIIVVTLIIAAGLIGVLLLFGYQVPFLLAVIVGLLFPFRTVESWFRERHRLAERARLEADCDFRGFLRYNAFVWEIERISAANEAAGAWQVLTEPVIVTDPRLRAAIEAFDAPADGQQPLDRTEQHVKTAFGR